MENCNLLFTSKMKQAINSLLMGVLMVLIVETSPQRKG